MKTKPRAKLRRTLARLEGTEGRMVARLHRLKDQYYKNHAALLETRYRLTSTQKRSTR